MRDKKLALVAASIGLGLTSALFTAQAERKALIDNRPVGSYIELDGVELHYTDNGTGDAVVLLHGNAVSHADFRACGLIERLATTHRVIVFDRPGCGHSTRPATKEWSPGDQAELIFAALQRLAVEKADIVSHSMGTVIALAMALREPHRVSRLVLISGYYYPTRRVDVALAAPLSLPFIGTACFIRLLQ